jgi:pantothenate kinase
MLNLSLTVLQHVPPLCDYKVWIDTERDVEVKRYLRSMVELNMMEECRRAAFFARQREMDREEYKENREQERSHKCEKARRAKEAYERGGDEALRKSKWPSLTQD